LIREYKGLDLLLRALDPELCSDLNLRILIVGEFYEPKQKYIDILNEREINDFVTIVDQFIPDDEIKNYFCAADLIVQPYKTATQSGISQIAYQFNKPMLVTNVGGLPEIVENEKSGLVVDPDPVSIRSAIERFFKMDLGSKFIDGIAKKKEEFSWKRFVEILLSEPKKIK
jgi:glycosyltransferase involved in cell wall biosynthesis